MLTYPFYPFGLLLMCLKRRKDRVMITHLSARIKNVVKEINPNQNKIDVIALIYKTLKTQNHRENNQGCM